MVADGLTKRSVDSTMLASIMSGAFKLNNPVHGYQGPTAGSTTREDGQIGEGGGHVSAFSLEGHPSSVSSEGNDLRHDLSLYEYREPTVRDTTGDGVRIGEGGGYVSAISEKVHSGSIGATRQWVTTPMCK